MYDYYSSSSGKLSAIANILLVVGIILLFIYPPLAILSFICTVILWFKSASLHKRALRNDLHTIDKEFSDGFKQSASRLAEKYKSPGGIAKLRAEGFSDDEIKILQETAEEDAEKGVFRED